MSTTRPIWNDGQGLATPDLQRGEDVAGSADDRVHEVVFTPGSVQKRILPLTEESTSTGVNGFTGNTRIIAVPSTSSLTPAGANGAVRLLPCQLMAGTPSASQQISLAGTNYGVLDTTAITSNASGSTRYDLIYATLNRSVTVTGTRKIKSATDGSLSSPTINLADAPAITLSINPGFLTGATAPTTAQINAAVPADTAPSSSTAGVFNFAIGYVTVANGYTSGTTLAQTAITQAWAGGWVQPHRIQQLRPFPTFYTGAATEKPGGTPLTDRWGSQLSYFVHLKLVTATPTSAGATILLDSTIDWRHRLIWGYFFYLGSATIYPLETTATTGNVALDAVVQTGRNWGKLTAMFTTGNDPVGGLVTQYGSSVNNAIGLFVVTATGNLTFYRGSTLIDAANGDAIALMLYATDQFRSGV